MLRTFLSLLVLICSVVAHGQLLSWNLITNRAAWFPRDSSGELVYDNRLWIMGGWVNSYELGPRDVWSSEDGAQWAEVTPAAQWEHGDLFTTMVFKDRMWALGGWYAGRLTNAGAGASCQVWSSTNGVLWELATAQPGWSPRMAAAGTVFRDKMWIFGGTEQYYYGNSNSVKSDVWSTSDGTNWVQEVEVAPWPARAYHAVVAFGDKLWLFGGGNYTPSYWVYNDVWSSTDGRSWVEVTPNAPWNARLWFSAVVYRDHIWLLGGWTGNPYTNWGDVWISPDGISWQEFRTAKTWSARHEHSTYVFHDQIWIAGGYAAPLANDVWSLSVPANWFQENLALSWNSSIENAYRLESKRQLEDPQWSVEAADVIAIGAVTTMPARIDSAPKFYRVVNSSGNTNTIQIRLSYF